MEKVSRQKFIPEPCMGVESCTEVRNGVYEVPQPYILESWA